VHISNTHIIKFDDTTLHKEPPDTLVEISIAVNDKEVFDKDYNVSALKQTCFNLPETKAVRACADFTDTVLNTTMFYTCVRLELDIAKHKIASAKLGCFHLKV
jgi:hypothetical protein